MILGVPASELFLLAVLIGIAGLVTGILAGLFGIGGGALIVPVLYEVLGALGVDDAVRFQLCVGTSLAIIVPTNIISARVHRERGAVMMDIVRASWLPAIVGVAVGAASVETTLWVHHQAELTAGAFAPAFLVVSLISAASAFFFWQMPDDAGHEISGRKALAISSRKGAAKAALAASEGTHDARDQRLG